MKAAIGMLTLGMLTVIALAGNAGATVYAYPDGGYFWDDTPFGEKKFAWGSGDAWAEAEGGKCFMRAMVFIKDASGNSYGRMPHDDEGMCGFRSRVSAYDYNHWLYLGPGQEPAPLAYACVSYTPVGTAGGCNADAKPPSMGDAHRLWDEMNHLEFAGNGRSEVLATLNPDDIGFKAPPQRF